MRTETRIGLWLTVALASAALLAGGAEYTLRHHALAPTPRLVVALLPAGGVIPVVAALTAAVRHPDEYWRRVQLVALAVAFGGTGALVVTLTSLERAGVITRWGLGAVFPAMAVLYLVGLVLAWWRYR